MNIVEVIEVNPEGEYAAALREACTRVAEDIRKKNNNNCKVVSVTPLTGNVNEVSVTTGIVIVYEHFKL